MIDLGPDDLPEHVAFASVNVSDLIDGDPRELALLQTSTVASRRTTFGLGRQAAHEALRQLGRDDGPILAQDRAPIWPAGIVGSIAHVRDSGVALTALASATDGVGVDLELRKDVSELERHVPVDGEREWLNEVAPESRADTLVSVFSAKECVYKAFYPRVRRYFGFDTVCLTPADGGFEGRFVRYIDSTYREDVGFRINNRWYDDLVLSWMILPKTS